MKQPVVTPALCLCLLAALAALAASQADGQCAAGVCEQLTELQEDDVSLLALTTQVHSRSHRKEAVPQQPPPPQQPVVEASSRVQSRAYVAVAPVLEQEAVASPATEEFEAEEAEEDALVRGQYPERLAAEEEEPVSPFGEAMEGADFAGAAPAAAQVAEAPRRRQQHHKRAAAAKAPQPLPAAAVGPAAVAAAAPELPPNLATAAADANTDEFVPFEDEEEPGAAWGGSEVYAPAHLRKRLGGPAARAPDPRTPVPLPETAGKVAAGATAASLARPSGQQSQRSNSGFQAVLSGSVEAPISLLVVGTVFLTGVGAFLMHEVSRRLRPRKRAKDATVKTPPLQPGTVDKNFLFHVLNCVESEKGRHAPAAELKCKVPAQTAQKQRDDDSSDDCSECPRPEKEPESEFDTNEDVFGQIREADWALQIAYLEALQRRNEATGGRASGSNNHSSAKNNEALAALYQKRAEALRGNNGSDLK